MASSFQSYNERAALKELYLQYIGPLDKYLTCGNGLAGCWEPADQVSHVLRLGGQLFFHCGNIIYTKVYTPVVLSLFCTTCNMLMRSFSFLKGKPDCLLALLNSTLLIPLTFSDLSKELPAIFSSSFQQCLPLVMTSEELLCLLFYFIF